MIDKLELEKLKKLMLILIQGLAERLWRLNAFFSRKLVLSFIIIVLSFVAIVLKIKDVLVFVVIFKLWCWLLLGIFAIYTGGNVGTKFSNNKK